ncbi:esterase/lipase family protein [Streptomyces sp. HK10]|uniref:esterase/lipase family protein n=1 Tax=Streptomyces sp. HK10 TaxID=3373255 RepID=UPI003748CC17
MLALTLQAPAAAAAASPSAYGPGSNPILFVHGWNSSGSTWNTMADRFRADGWPTSHLKQWTYNTGQSNATTAQQLATEVDRLLAATGASQVDVITHSMGGLSSRYYAKNLGGAAKIDAWVSLGGPNHGTDTAYWCFQTSCYEMRIGSSYLNSLNSGDETPGSARYATWWSPCDTVINPDSSVALSGAVNNRTACLSHSGLLSDSTVYGQVRDTVNS